MTEFCTDKTKVIVTFLLSLIGLITSSEVCWDKFDDNLRKQCKRGEWQQRYYYDHNSMTCQLFWYDGCETKSRNLFNDLLNCQWMCEEQVKYKDKSCLDKFDEHYKDVCNGGKWKQHYYFDKNSKRCTPFWYDGCRGSSQNLYSDLGTCRQVCEIPAQEAERESQQSHQNLVSQSRQLDESGVRVTTIRTHTAEFVQHQHRHHQKPFTVRPISKEDLKYSESPDNDRTLAGSGGRGTSHVTQPSRNICERQNPCQNDGTCVFDKLKRTYFCECKNGYQGRNCETFDDSDPCATAPCKNGATCSPKKNKLKADDTPYECFCAVGYGGPNCEEKPCAASPCKNGGTCRTTVTNPYYFCECAEGYADKECGTKTFTNTSSTPKFGKNVKLISSGQPEWIEELKKNYKKQSGNYTVEEDSGTSEANGTSPLRSKTTIRQLKGTDENATGNTVVSWVLVLVLYFGLRVLG
ncbi:unnamed protein product [Bursaphelenchus okinawaensis]|uniref:Uncharacterized protein n=1 Tax=Bursaphelenchus okinawaensis TaxID=465554 RepID=A0A811LEP0_9BILA|nr:unnamed protein product [Bursaphelenchus okinawaensis]CAG9121820.1 unnamed protein product [Bursaphelenchus okinawaensis]